MNPLPPKGPGHAKKSREYAHVCIPCNKSQETLQQLHILRRLKKLFNEFFCSITKSFLAIPKKILLLQALIKMNT